MAATAKQGLCSNCNRAISVPRLVNYSAESQTGVCRTCIAKQARAPKTCANCSQPLHANATPGTWCTACAFPLAVEVVGNHALKSHPTMPNRKRIGFVRAVMQRPNVATVPAPCRRTPRQAHGVPHVHIHRAVEVAASPAHMKEDTTPSTSRFGCVKHAVYAMVTRRVQCAVCNARKKVDTMSMSCRTGPAKPAR